MEDRKGWYLKPGTRASAPGVLFSVCVSPRIDPMGTTGTLDYWSWGGADVCCAHYRNRKWMKRAEARCDSPAELWAWMHEHADRERRNYVIAPAAGEALSMSQFWAEMDTGRVVYQPVHVGSPRRKKCTAKPNVMEIKRVVLGHRTTILDYARNGFKWLWLSGKQFFACSEDELSKSMGQPWEDTPDHTGVHNQYTRTTGERAKLWLTTFMRLCDWWRDNARAPFGFTAAGLSWGMLRTYTAPKALCHHQLPQAWQLERESSFGGRASVWYYGDIGVPKWCDSADNPAPAPSRYGSIPGPVVMLDVASMYPWLLRERKFPVRLWRYI